MADLNHKQRFLQSLLPPSTKRELVLITGARQTGKTTLVKQNYPELAYFNFDAPEIRDQLRLVTSHRWGKTLGSAIFDEAQKLPIVFEKIKYAYDERQIDFSVLLGSSQILLLKKISESLAGRIAIYELFPLMLSELVAQTDLLSPPLLDQLLKFSTLADLSAFMDEQPDILLGDAEINRAQAQDYLLEYGGMPALLHIPEHERSKWLKAYEYTYLQRDLSDLAKLNDLEPFRRLQQLAALRASKLLNYSELARDVGISVDTTRRYLEYLRISYQVFLLAPYSENLTSSAIKTPKLYWLDQGILRQLTGQKNIVTGELFENMVISEIVKWTRTQQYDVELFFYRTYDGLEVDLLIQTQDGIIGIEVKSAKKAHKKDIKALTKVADSLGDRWLGGLLVYQGSNIEKMTDTIWAIPSYRLLS